MIYKFTEVLNDLVILFLVTFYYWKVGKEPIIFQTIWQRNLPQMKVGIGLLVKVLLSP